MSRAFTNRISEVTKALNSLDHERLEHPVSPAYPTIAPQSPHCPTCHCHSGSSILIDGRFERFLTEKQPYRWNGKEYTKGSRRAYIFCTMDWTFNWCDVARATIDMLPDVALLEIFDFYVRDAYYRDRRVWHTLVHVCRKWRFVAFGSPRRLDLRLVCGARTPVRETLDVWPRFPIIIYAHTLSTSMSGNILAGLEHNDRVCEMYITAFSRSRTENVWAALQQPFPALTRLEFLFQFLDEAAPVVSASFLGGSAPALQTLWLDSTPFPGIPNFLLSATHLVYLRLTTIPHSGYFSPEAMVTALSTLTSLQTLWLDLQSPLSCPERESRRPPPPTRAVLPALTTFWFKGVPEYVEDLMTRIDSPRLEVLHITFFNQVVFETPQFTKFIHRTPTLKPLEKARLVFQGHAASVNLSSQASEHGTFSVEILCREFDWQVSSVEQVCASCLPPILMLEELYIYEARHSQPEWKDNIENQLWLELLHPFIAVKNIYLSEKIAQRIVPALEELVGGRATVLPALQNIFLEEPQPSGSLGPVQKGIQQFVATRQTTSHPIAVSRWDRGRFYEVDG